MQPQILLTDEKLFVFRAIYNSRNNTVFVKCRTSFKRQKPNSVMVWAGVMSTDLKTLLIFINAGIKINQHIYLNILKDKVASLVKKVTENEEITLQ